MYIYVLFFNELQSFRKLMHQSDKNYTLFWNYKPSGVEFFWLFYAHFLQKSCCFKLSFRAQKCPTGAKQGHNCGMGKEVLAEN